MIAPIHMFTAAHQEATSFTMELEGKTVLFKFNPRRQLMCFGCRRLRHAKNLTVQVYYDSLHFWCMGRKNGRCPK